MIGGLTDVTVIGYCILIRVYLVDALPDTFTKINIPTRTGWMKKVDKFSENYARLHFMINASVNPLMQFLIVHGKYWFMNKVYL